MKQLSKEELIDLVFNKCSACAVKCRTNKREYIK